MIPPDDTDGNNRDEAFETVPPSVSDGGTAGTGRADRDGTNPEARGPATDVVSRFGSLFDRIDDAIVETELCEEGPLIREVNPAFEDLFGYDREAVLGKPINEVLVPEGGGGRARELDRRGSAGEQTTAIVRRETADGVREFLLRVVPCESDSARTFGIYSDITDQRRYERHSRVIHRVLRHNLRNDLSVILALAESLSDADDPSVRERANTICEHAERIASLREETRPLDQVFDDGRDIAPRELGPLCRLAVEAAVDDPAAVTVDVPKGLTALAVPQLQRAVESLVENARQHAGTDPTVTVRGRLAGDAVHVDVLDDGPGIPEHERAPVFENRDITQLEHGSGLGLWLARWTVEACDGHLTYHRTDDGHTAVRLVLQAPTESNSG